MDIYILILTLVILSKDSTKACNTVSDPCLDENHDILPNPDGRCPACGIGDECDKFTMSEHTWYRSDTTMTDTCVHPGACGTNYPIWMKGNNETDAGDIKDVVGCLSTFADCCYDTFPLKTKSCDGFHVHCFLELPNGCPQRFCFDSPTETNITTNTTMELSISSTTTTTTKQTSNVPSLQMTTTRKADCIPVYQEPCSCPIAMVLAISVTSTAFVAAVIGMIIFRRCFSSRNELAPTNTKITKQVADEDYLTPSHVKTMNEYDYITYENRRW